MELSSELCRIQEAFQRERANNALLDNVRVIAETAAAAWGNQAAFAERAEARRAVTRAIGEASALAKATFAGKEMLPAHAAPSGIDTY